MPAFRSSTSFDSLFWISSLGEAERGTSERVLEDLEPCLAAHGLGFLRYTPKTAGDLIAFLDSVAFECSKGRLPILVIDTHGHKDQGIKVDATGEFVDWQTLLNKFGNINLAMKNQLIIISNACFGAYILLTVSWDKICLFYALFASEKNTIWIYRREIIQIFKGADYRKSRSKRPI